MVLEEGKVLQYAHLHDLQWRRDVSLMARSWEPVFRADPHHPNH